MKRGFIDFEKRLIQEYTIIDIMEYDDKDGVYFCGNCPSCGRVCYFSCIECRQEGRHSRPTVYYNKDRKIVNPLLIQILLTGNDAPHTERDYARANGARLKEFTPRRLYEEIHIIDRISKVNGRKPNEKVRKYLRDIGGANNKKANLSMTVLI